VARPTGVYQRDEAGANEVRIWRVQIARAAYPDTLDSPHPQRGYVMEQIARLSRIAATLLITGCAHHQTHGPGPADSCNTPLEPYLRIDLYTDRSNRNHPSGRLTDEEWKTFVEEVLVKHFPAGGTVFENSGWWRRPNGTTFHGVGRTMIMLVPRDDVRPDRAAVREVIAQIKSRYGPSSVGWEERWVCAAF
jgi:hypothetical protein